MPRARFFALYEAQVAAPRPRLVYSPQTKRMGGYRTMDAYVTGAAIRRLREARALTQAQLAEKLDVSSKTVSKWETGVSQS